MSFQNINYNWTENCNTRDLERKRMINSTTVPGYETPAKFKVTEHSFRNVIIFSARTSIA